VAQILDGVADRLRLLCCCAATVLPPVPGPNSWIPCAVVRKGRPITTGGRRVAIYILSAVLQSDMSDERVFTYNGGAVPPGETQNIRYGISETYLGDPVRSP